MSRKSRYINWDRIIYDLERQCADRLETEEKMGWPGDSHIAIRVSVLLDLIAELKESGDEKCHL